MVDSWNFKSRVEVDMSEIISPPILRIHIRATLKMAGMWNPDIEELLLGTAAQETHCGYWRRQMGGGPGRGIYSMEIATEQDIWKTYLAYRPDLVEHIRDICGVCGPDSWSLETNLSYQTIMARIKYRRIKEPIPLATDIQGQAEYWDKYYNCNPIKGTADEYIKNYWIIIKGVKNETDIQNNS
jgi:hypothetical protein